jgi:4'-phosphopantetheinyl transferase
MRINALQTCAIYGSESEMDNITTSDPLRRVALDEDTPFASLAPGCVHVWCVTGEDIDDPAVLRQGASDLTAPEVARAGRFAKQEDRRRFIIGRWMLRHLLGAYSLAVPRKITFAINQHGGLELAGLNRLRIHFNLSHTDGLVACAFTSGTEIGIDVERMQPSRVDMEIAYNYFSVTAYRDILNASEDSRTERFFEYWVLMEACAKARGTGLVRPAVGCFVLEDAGRSRIRFIPSQANDPIAWNFWLVEPAVEYRMAVAMAGERSGPPIVRRLRPDGSYNTICRTVTSGGTFRLT